MKKASQFLFFATIVCALLSFTLPAQGPELPIELINRKWVITKIDPTGMPTWATMSEEGKRLNNNVNQKMIERGSYYAFMKKGKADILVYNPFHKAEFCNVLTTYTYNKTNQYITLQEAEKKDANGDTFRVPSMEYKIEKLTKEELILVVVANNYKLFFKPAKK